MADCALGLPGWVPCNQALNHLTKWLCNKGSNIRNLPENLTDLEKRTGELKARRHDVRRRVKTEEERNGLQRYKEVDLWLQKVSRVEKEFDDLSRRKSVQLGRLCLFGLCSTNLVSSYHYGEKVLMMLKEVSDLIKSSEFVRGVAGLPTTATGEEWPLHANIVGQETILANTWNHIKDDEVGIIGLYGMGGVGKSTLLRQINNQFSRSSSSIEYLIWVDVSKRTSVEKIQEEVSKKLGLYGEGWSRKTETDKTSAIYNFMKKKRFVLLLDDIWVKVDLQRIGVPHPTKENRCKIAFTTRSREVCGRMGVDKPIEVKYLNDNDAWDLFKKKVGQNTLGSHPDIRELAWKVAKKCHGLPLALNTIGETMASKKTVRDWINAIDVLSSSSTTEITGMDPEILKVLKYSYDSLNTVAKTCFRYCALFPSAFTMRKVDLIEYWICENFFEENIGRERAMSQGYEIIDKLVGTCLLEEGNSKQYVKMHNVVHKMAIWVATDLGRNKENRIVHANDDGLCELPRVTNWGNVARMLLMNTHIEMLSGSPNCSRLTTLLLQNNPKLVYIRGEFFKHMPRILVLNLSCNNLKTLPKQISDLISLRYLDLSSTQIQKLPDLRKLKNLIHLNLEWTCSLQSIAGISDVPLLRVLRLLSSKCLVDLKTVEELKRLERLEILTIDISSHSALDELLRSQRLANCIQRLSIEALRILVLSTVDGLIDLTIKSCSMLEVEIKRPSLSGSVASPTFCKLSKVCISSCNGLKDLTWLLFAPNLTVLELGVLKKLEDIMSEEKAAQLKLQGVAPFRKLENLDLSDLPLLKQVYWRSMSFPCLESIKVKRCPKLRKLPLDSRSNVSGNTFVIRCNDENWIESVRWEDQATKDRFLPYCQKR